MEAIRQIVSVFAVFLLLGAALWKLRRGRAQPNKGRSLELTERLALTPQHALHLVRVEGRAIVLATHPQGCTVIAGTTVERGAGA